MEDRASDAAVLPFGVHLQLDEGEMLFGFRGRDGANGLAVLFDDPVFRFGEALFEPMILGGFIPCAELTEDDVAIGGMVEPSEEVGIGLCGGARAEHEGMRLVLPVFVP